MKNGLRSSWLELAALPHADNVQAGQLPEVRVSNRSSDQRRAVNRELGNHEILEFANAMRGLRARRHSGSELLAKALFEGDDGGCAREFQYVDRIESLGEGDDGNVRSCLPYGQRNIRILGIAQIGDHHSCVGDANRLVGRSGVPTPSHHVYALGVQGGRSRRLGFNHDVRNRHLVQPGDEALGNQIMSTDDDVVRGLLTDFARGAHSDLRLEPRRIEEADEGKRGHDQQHHHPVHEHDDAESTAKVARECDVAEAEGAHHRQRPVEPGQP